MIYALAATQAITVVAILIGVKWVVEYLAARDKQEQLAYQFYMETLTNTSEAINQTVKDLVVQQMKERELLFERVQHPEQTAGQAAGATGSEPKVSYTDEEAMAIKDYGPDGVIPIQPIQPVKAGEDYGSA